MTDQCWKAPKSSHDIQSSSLQCAVLSLDASSISGQGRLHGERPSQTANKPVGQGAGIPGQAAGGVERLGSSALPELIGWLDRLLWLVGSSAAGNDMDDNSLDTKRAQLTQDHHDFLRGHSIPCCRSLSGIPDTRAKLLATKGERGTTDRRPDLNPFTPTVPPSRHRRSTKLRACLLPSTQTPPAPAAATATHFPRNMSRMLLPLAR